MGGRPDCSTNTTKLNGTAYNRPVYASALHQKPCEVFFRQLAYGEQSILGTRIYAKGDFGEALRLMGCGAVKVLPLASHTFPMADYGQAFTVAADSSKSCKILIHVNDAENAVF